ncbi:rab effector MyRIP isoform X2 [Pygocentrus nattereri]|uniref:RabBD domain-containing protein n=1 Tax=Pygocentrus nattereri TaxID=42514 RepID=A0A3B4DQV0_PYGNA|nr:rab effector MyRIP isoform X2 [Pygocentrus nattereri]
MGRKLDLSGLTDGEAEHVLRVVQRDMKLRKKEEDRLSDLKQELEEEGSRCLLLVKQHRFNEQCCIRCCQPFSFLLNPRRACLDCTYNVCKACCSYSQQERGYVCSACHKTRFLRTQSLEWYYNNVKSRFKRFGSAKVLKTLYRKHIIERGALSELPEVSAPEGSNDNDGSVCGSDSPFYKHSEGHSMAETLTVALRVAEEAIEEAITKAESYRDSLEKQNEARYLRDHKEELIEELATTIVQKIIKRGKRPEMQAEYDFVWSQAQNSDLPSPTSALNAHTSAQHTHTSPQLTPPAPASLKSSYTLWRSRSAFSLTSDESPDKAPEADADEPPAGCEAAEPEPDIQLYSSLRRESRASSVPGWKSVDRLDNSSASSVLQSPDGNWIALQSSQHLRPSLLTKRKSLVFSVLEKESGVVSAYDEMGSDSDAEDQSGWGVALLQFRRRLSDESYYTDSQHDPEWTYARHHPAITSPSSGQYTNTETLNSDSEASTAPPTRPRRPMHNIHQRKKGPTERHLPYTPYAPYRRPPDLTAPPPLRSDTLDVNFNPRVGGDSSEGEERSSEQIRRSRRRRRSKRELAEQSHRAHNALYSSATAENSAVLLNVMMMRRQLSQEAQPPLLHYQTPDTVTPPDLLTPGAMTPEPEYQDTVAPNSMAPSPPMHNPLGASKLGPTTQGLKLRASSINDTMDQELRSKLSELVGQISREDVTSSEDEPLRKVGDREREKESERLRQRERPNDGPKERIERSKSERQVERQISRERDRSDSVRPRRIEREQERERERQREVERQVERERERRVEQERQLDTEKQRDMERRAEKEKERRREVERQRREQARRLEMEGDIEEIEMARPAERELAQVNGPCTEAGLLEIHEVTGVTESALDGGVEKGKSVEEGNDATEDSLSEETTKRKSVQRSKSETVSGKRAELVETRKMNSVCISPDSSACEEEQTSPTEAVSDHAVQQRLQLLSSLLQQKYSAASLCSITTEVLKVLNATEELIGEAEGKAHDPVESPASTPLSSGPDSKKLDQHLTKMEENVYLAAGAVYGLEGALGDLEDCARSISSSTTETELAFLEDQVANAAAQVQQSELQVSDIEARISALKNAGLNVSACSRFSKYKPKSKPQTLDSSRQQRRKLPAPPPREKESKPEPQVRALRP